jgi:hypothetical protein
MAVSYTHKAGVNRLTELGKGRDYRRLICTRCDETYWLSEQRACFQKYGSHRQCFCEIEKETGGKTLHIFSHIEAV